jgi:hypothetical protein
VVEQGPFLEWQVSDFADSTSCQDCHLPQQSESGQPITTAIAHNPNGGDFGPVSPRSPVGRHLLVGGNTLVPQILRDFSSVLQPRASTAAFEATLAAVREQLAERTATVHIVEPDLTTDTLRFTAGITVLTGHKLPTGIPVRRAWLHTRVTDGGGAVVFESGQWDAAGRLIDSTGTPLPSEAVGGPVLPHVDQVADPSQVPVYEGVLANGTGDPTFLLMRGEGWAKDNRLLPAGFDLDAAGLLDIAPVGTEADPDFTGGSDAVHFTIDTAGHDGPFTIEVELMYQALSARWASEIFDTDTPETASFRTMYESVERGPEWMDGHALTLP